MSPDQYTEIKVMLARQEEILGSVKSDLIDIKSHGIDQQKQIDGLKKFRDGIAAVLTSIVVMIPFHEQIINFFTSGKH